MELDALERLIALMGRGGLRELEIEDNGQVLRLKRGAASIGYAAPLVTPDAPEKAPQKARVIEAPAFGVLHLVPSPGAQPYVAVGQDIIVGQQIGLIEAMKVFSSVRADHAGRVAEILVASGTEIEPGQALVVLA